MPDLYGLLVEFFTEAPRLLVILCYVSLIAFLAWVDLRQRQVIQDQGWKMESMAERLREMGIKVIADNSKPLGVEYRYTEAAKTYLSQNCIGSVWNLDRLLDLEEYIALKEKEQKEKREAAEDEITDLLEGVIGEEKIDP